MAFVVKEKIGEENARKHDLDKAQKDIRDKISKCDCLFAVKTMDNGLQSFITRC
ncbi:hypothetical protein [uncultured Campylobacter sp.]|jgi:hypothetical protein|uniref:hypothetical protein n=1 Tax=uncultured Campylobacter sp. TaxID=218934 RepID=UPI0026351A1E|nr:hypothetical protein [uncultured Campylobacter sp.]